jgi:hypothetical protein
MSLLAGGDHPAPLQSSLQMGAPCRCLTLALLIAASCCSSAGASSTGSSSTSRRQYSVSVNGVPPPTAPKISPGFVGLSLETYAREAMLGTPAHPRAALAQALANMARMTPGAHEGAVLRIGGNSADESCWLPEHGGRPIAPPSCNCAYNLTSVDLDAYRSFAALARNLGANVSFVLDTNLGCGNPALAAAHIAAITNAGLWDLVHAVEVGNEVDKFPGSKRPATWGTYCTLCCAGSLAISPHPHSASHLSASAKQSLLL